MNASELTYTGIDLLETLEGATNYNSILLDLVRESSQGRSRMLDFGAGTGTFAKLLRSKGIDVVCVEPDTQLAERLIRDGFLTFSDLKDVPDSSFEFIFTLNVLEHVKDDWSSFRQLASKLAKDGRLLVYVPAFQILWTTLDERLKHYRRYRRAALERFAQLAGLSVCKTRYVDSLGFFAALGFKIFGSKSGHLTARAVSLYDQYVMPLSRLLDLLAGRQFGKNVYLIASKDYHSSAAAVEPE